MFPAQTLRQMNCKHNVEDYFEIDSKWSRDDYCFGCLESIDDIEEHNQAQNE